ncbi:mRNA 3' end processing factor, partial [Spiromyces aspiralis]
MSAKDKVKMQEHLDWHFRRNRRAKERSYRIPLRGWFVPRDFWECAKELENNEIDALSLPFEGEPKPGDGFGDDEYDETTGTSKGRRVYRDSGGPDGSAEAGVMVAGRRSNSILQSLRNKRVAIDPSDQNKTCPVCREKFDVFWSDDDEEWMCRNAVVGDDGVLCHATCQYEMAKKDVKTEESNAHTATKRKSSMNLAESEGQQSAHNGDTAEHGFDDP